MMQTWILTFNRPQALNRQISTLCHWTDVRVFSNHSRVGLTEENKSLLDSGKLKIIVNSCSDDESTSYCARSWNQIFLKCFKDQEEAIFVQDDTLLPAGVKEIIEANKDKYDLIWAPAGDQFFYMKKDVLRKVGFFDERYSTGCFCGDADFLKRCWRALDKDRISVVEKHDWGFVHNDIGLGDLIPTHIGAKAVDPTYINQCQEIEKIDPENLCIRYAQEHWKNKWGHWLNGQGSMIQHVNPPRFPEIYMYPWFVKKYLGIQGLPEWCKDA